MIKTCTNCTSKFKIGDSDQILYSKLEVDAPTKCPKCRLVNRLAWRNDRTFYRRRCDKTGEEFISHYPDDVKFPVYKPSAWYSDDWDALKYGKDFDFNRPFFEQWQELSNNVPHLGIDIVGCENSDFCNYCGYDRNCYLDIAGENNEDCYFNLFTKYSKNCVDCTFAYHSELCFQSINCYKSYGLKYCMYVENSNNCAFSFDLKGCSDCLFSSNLRQKQYYIFNQPHTKEQYEAKVRQLDFTSPEKMKGYIAQWYKVIAGAVHRDMYILNSENCVGNDIQNSRNCEFAFNVLNCEDSKYLFDVLDAKDCMDLNYSLYHPEVALELISTLDMKYSAFAMASHHCNNVFYVDQCNNSSYLFGCVGLNRKQYCVLNKQYSKEEYEALVPKIIEHMRRDGSWGEFFPEKISPHPYETTVAHEYFPLVMEREKVFAAGQPPSLIPGSGGQLRAQNTFPLSANGEIKEVYDCADCAKPFRVISQELAFYKKQGLWLPSKCPNCRHLERLKIRKPRFLWKDKCAKCAKIINSSANPAFGLRVYCEGCYLGELV